MGGPASGTTVGELMHDGSITMLWQNPARRFPATSWPVDPMIAVLRIDQMDGQPLALLVNYAAHPVIFGPDNMRFSAEFPRRNVQSDRAGF